jgi:hypothetical protein
MIEAETMAAAVRATVGRAFWGVTSAIRERPSIFSAAAVATLVLSVALPPLLLSVARKPVDYFTVNPWLRRLPEYVAAPGVPWRQKLEKLPDLALFWFSADSPMGGTEWGFAVDVRDVARMIGTSLLVGAYFALWARARALGIVGPGARLGRRGGALGAVVSVVGLSTGPCSVMGCGAPILPVVGLAFVGLSSTTLAALSSLSTVATAVVVLGLGGGVAFLGWLTGRRTNLSALSAAP